MAKSTADNQTYPKRWTPDEGMREISGFGGGYELACWSMLRAGGEWADEHKWMPDPERARIANMPKDMEAAMVAAAEPGGATGAMYGVVASHIHHILWKGWEWWVEQMRADLRDELNGGTEVKRAKPE